MYRKRDSAKDQWPLNDYERTNEGEKIAREGEKVLYITTDGFLFLFSHLEEKKMVSFVDIVRSKTIIHSNIMRRRDTKETRCAYSTYAVVLYRRESTISVI